MGQDLLSFYVSIGRYIVLLNLTLIRGVEMLQVFSRANESDPSHQESIFSMDDLVEATLPQN
jgi:hypothetical protein